MQHTALSPEEDRATARGNIWAKENVVRFDMWFLRYARGRTDTQTR